MPKKYPKCLDRAPHQRADAGVVCMSLFCVESCFGFARYV